jgi:hypothetical protein
VNGFCEIFTKKDEKKTLNVAKHLITDRAPKLVDRENVTKGLLGKFFLDKAQIKEPPHVIFEKCLSALS